MDKCSINSKSRTSEYSCLTKKDLVEVYNKIFGKDVKNTSMNKKELHRLLTKHIGITEELWWVSDKNLPARIVDKIKYYIYKPYGPIKDSEWLYSSDINTIMKQYEKYINDKNVSFTYYKTIGSDHFTHNTFVDNGKNTGIIFNTDKEGGKGEHWVSVYITKKTVHYYDSLGNKPYGDILKFIKSLNKKIIVDSKKHQNQDGLCGLYAIEFIVRKALDRDMADMTDNNIGGTRKKLFKKYEI